MVSTIRWYHEMANGTEVLIKVNNIDIIIIKLIDITWINMINYTVHSTKFKQVRFLKVRL